MDDFFAELEAEIASATKVSNLKAQAANARKTAATMKLPPKVRADALAEFKELQAILEASEWTSISTIALFSEQRCDGCGSISRAFLQFMELQQLIRKPSTQKWVRIARPVAEDILPRETMVQPHYTHICPDCCDDHGFVLADASELHSTPFPIAPSQTYIQEDLNDA
jgi:hypothetical protein